jgi:hypothetical protein
VDVRDAVGEQRRERERGEGAAREGFVEADAVDEVVALGEEGDARGAAEAVARAVGGEDTGVAAADDEEVMRGAHGGCRDDEAGGRERDTKSMGRI